MTLDDYRDAWRESPDPDREGADEEELLAFVREQSAAFEKKIRRRDLLETLAVVVVAAFFGYELVTATSWLVRAGAALVIAGGAFVVWWLHRARRAGPDRAGDRPVAEQLRAQRERLDIQIRLLKSVLWWYLAPLAAGAVLFAVGQGTPVWSTALTLGVVAVVCVVVWRLNQRAVERKLGPRRRELTRLLEQLDEEGADRERP